MRGGGGERPALPRLGLEAVSLDVGLLVVLPSLRISRVSGLVVHRLGAMSFDVLLVLSGLRPFALFLHGFSFRRRQRTPPDQTSIRATIFPLFPSLRNSALSSSP